MPTISLCLLCLHSCAVCGWLFWLGSGNCVCVCVGGGSFRQDVPEGNSNCPNCLAALSAFIQIGNCTGSAVRRAASLSDGDSHFSCTLPKLDNFLSLSLSFFFYKLMLPDFMLRWLLRCLAAMKEIHSSHSCPQFIHRVSAESLSDCVSVFFPTE